MELTKEDRLARLQYIRRQADWQQQLETFTQGVQEAAGVQLNREQLLSVEDIDTLNLHPHHPLFKNYLNLNFLQPDTEKITSVLSALQPYIQHRKLYFRTASYDDLMFRTEADRLLSSFITLMDFDGNTLYFIDEECRNGLWIDLYEEYWDAGADTDRLLTYELRIFGPDWIKAVSALLPLG